MSAIPAESPSQAGVRKSRKSLGKVVLLALLIPLVAFIAVEANVLRQEQRTEQARRQIGAAGGRCETERRVPGWLQPVFGPDAHSFLDRTAIVGVTMTGEEVGDEQVAKVIDVPEIGWINLGESKVTSAGLASVAKLPSLVVVDLTNTQVSDLTELTKLSNLLELRLDYCRNVEVEHLAVLSKMPQLRVLGANGLRWTDEGVAMISGCGELEQLTMMGAKLGENGLAPLQKLKNLKQLKLTHSTYSPADLAALQKALPELQVAQ